MELIKNNELYNLYEYIKDGNDYSDLLTVPLPREHLLPNHPDPFYPAKAIVEFIQMDGPKLWADIKNEKFKAVHDWAIVEGHDLHIQHPLTGDTIFHVQPILESLFAEDINDHKLIMNWHGHNSIIQD